MFICIDPQRKSILSVTIVLLKNCLTLQTFIAFNLNALLFESDSRHGVGFPMIGYALSRTGKVGTFLVKKLTIKK